MSDKIITEGIDVPTGSFVGIREHTVEDIDRVFKKGKAVDFPYLFMKNFVTIDSISLESFTKEEIYNIPHSIYKTSLSLFLTEADKKLEELENKQKVRCRCIRLALVTVLFLITILAGYI